MTNLLLKLNAGSHRGNQITLFINLIIHVLLCFLGLNRASRHTKLFDSIYEMLNYCSTWIYSLRWDAVSSINASLLRESFAVVQTHSIKLMDFLSFDDVSHNPCANLLLKTQFHLSFISFALVFVLSVSFLG